MLRTFRSNPALGGFGGEDSPSDAVCQIVKELTDNAVDACNDVLVSTNNNNTPKRVRVVFEKEEEESDDGNNDLLRVTITDNGCGMDDIEKCVGAFHSSKAHNNNNYNEQQTSGRYGIGLTLCLLHAQRLVPDSCASIQSATCDDDAYTVRAVVVDTLFDTVRCLPRPSLCKSHFNESGTCISLLVPGGETATRAWPRLAEYFARFKLSLGLRCSLQVLAPTLSRVPLYIKPIIMIQETPSQCGKKRSKTKLSADDSTTQEETSDETIVWQNGLEDESNDEVSDTNSSDQNTNNKTMKVTKERLEIWKATSLFLGRPVELANVAHEMVPIRIKKASSKKRANHTGPKLEVDIIVHGPDDDDEESGEHFEDDMEEVDVFSSSDQDNVGAASKLDGTLSCSATLMLVRMVNKIPLLDSSEAIACGLVQGLSAKKRLWNSFGLDVHHKHDRSNAASVPIFEVRDSEQVAPFFKKGAHNLLEEETRHISDDDDKNLAANTKRKSKHRNLLPASVRLGNILVIVQIHAEPTMLPLPTLSKGRLPTDSKAIDDAFEIGLTKCLQQLQKTNPNLLLTASELRRVERDIKYIPAVSLALASIVAKSVASGGDSNLKERILSWGTQGSAVPDVALISAKDSSSSQQPSARGFKAQEDQNKDSEVERMGKSIEERLRLILSKPAEKPKKKKPPKQQEEKEETNSATSEVSSIDDLASLGVDWGVLDQQPFSKQGLKQSSAKDTDSVDSMNLLEDIPESRTPKNHKRSKIVSPEDDNGFYEDW